MGNRITIGQLIEWLQSYDENSDVAFKVEGQSLNGNAYQIKQIIERCITAPGRTTNGDTTVFIDVSAKSFDQV